MQVSQLLLLDNQDATKDIKMFINSPGERVMQRLGRIWVGQRTPAVVPLCVKYEAEGVVAQARQRHRRSTCTRGPCIVLLAARRKRRCML